MTRPLPTDQPAPVFGDLAIRTLVAPFSVYLVAFTVVGWFDGLSYPVGYSVALGAAVLAMLVAWRGYRVPPFHVGWISVLVGIVGVFVWVGLWMLDREVIGIAKLVGSGREAFNPFDALASTPTWLCTFVSIRFVGLVLVVPIVEEFFIRGFLMRYVESVRWDAVALGHGTRMSVGAVAVYAVLAHPGEALSAIVWFSMVTWLYLRTRNIWDCVVAHLTTNFLLGIYVVLTGTWELW